MKYQRWSAAALFVICTAGPAIAQKSDTASKILALEEKWNDAYKRGDIQTMNALLASDLIITVEDGAIYGKTGYIAHISGTSEHPSLAEMSDVKVRMHGNVAVVAGAYHETGTSEGKPYEYRDRFTDVWLKGEAGWQLIASHYSVPIK